MNKKEFLEALSASLKDVKKEEREETLAYYEEIIADRCDGGMSEKEAVSSLGSIDDIVRHALEDAHFEKEESTNERVTAWDAIKALIVGICIVCANLWMWELDLMMWVSGIVVTVFGLPNVMTYTASYVGVGICMCACALALCVPIIKFTKWSFMQIKEYFFKIKSFFEGLGGNK